MSREQPVTQQGDAILWTMKFFQPSGSSRVPVDLTQFGTPFTAAIYPETQHDSPIPFTVDASQANIGVLVLSMSASAAQALAAGASYPFKIKFTSTAGVMTLYSNRAVVQ